jgi:hypothetical protein
MALAATKSPVHIPNITAWAQGGRFLRNAASNAQTMGPLSEQHSHARTKS